MKKSFVLILVLCFVAITGCFTVKKNDTYVRSRSKELAQQALEPSPGWSVAEGAVARNPNAGVHYKNGNEEFDYYPPGSENGKAPAVGQPPRGGLPTCFENDRNNTVNIMIVDANSTPIKIFRVPGHGQLAFTLPKTTVKWHSVDLVTNETFDSPWLPLTGKNKYPSRCGEVNNRFFVN